LRILPRDGAGFKSRFWAGGKASGNDEGTDKQDPPMVAFMANGTSGDVNNINFLHPRPAKKPYEQMRFVADDL